MYKRQLLPPVQAQVALSLASGASITQAAREAGVGRTTIYEWRKFIPDFNDAVVNAAYAYTESLRDQLRALSAKALVALDQVLDDPKASPSVKLRAALAVLNRPRFPKHEWSIPERACTYEELEEDEEDESIDDFRTLLNTSERDSDLFAPVEPRRVEKVGLNEPCPCGSGQKYKKCCLGQNFVHPRSSAAN